MTRGNSGVVATLRAERERRLASVDSLLRAFDGVVAASESANADDEHDPEGATIAFERSQLSAQLSLARAGVAEVDQALSRAHAGRYGACENCGKPIAAERLTARPTATTCIGCA